MPRPCGCPEDRKYTMSQPLDPKEQLYKSTLLKHYREASNRRKVLSPEQGMVWKEESRSCGDRISLCLRLDDLSCGPVTITEAFFSGEGCSISVASADMAADILKGLSVDEARRRSNEVLLFLARLEKMEQVCNPIPDYSDLACLESLAKFPTRVACARLAWNAALTLLGTN